MKAEQKKPTSTTVEKSSVVVPVSNPSSSEKQNDELDLFSRCTMSALQESVIAKLGSRIIDTRLEQFRLIVPQIKLLTQQTLKPVTLAILYHRQNGGEYVMCIFDDNLYLIDFYPLIGEKSTVCLATNPLKQGVGMNTDLCFQLNVWDETELVTKRFTFQPDGEPQLFSLFSAFTKALEYNGVDARYNQPTFHTLVEKYSKVPPKIRTLSASPFLWSHRYLEKYGNDEKEIVSTNPLYDKSKARDNYSSGDDLSVGDDSETPNSFTGTPSSFGGSSRYLNRLQGTKKPLSFTPPVSSPISDSSDYSEPNVRVEDNYGDYDLSRDESSLAGRHTTRKDDNTDLFVKAPLVKSNIVETKPASQLTIQKPVVVEKVEVSNSTQEADVEKLQAQIKQAKELRKSKEQEMTEMENELMETSDEEEKESLQKSIENCKKYIANQIKREKTFEKKIQEIRKTLTSEKSTPETTPVESSAIDKEVNVQTSPTKPTQETPTIKEDNETDSTPTTSDNTTPQPTKRVIKKVAVKRVVRTAAASTKE